MCLIKIELLNLNNNNNNEKSWTNIMIFSKNCAVVDDQLLFHLHSDAKSPPLHSQLTFRLRDRCISR